MKVLNPHQASQPGDPSKGGNPQGIWPWKLAGFDYRISTGLGKTETPVLEAQTKSLCTKTQRKGVVTSQDTEPLLPASIGGPPVEALVGRDSPQGQGTSNNRPGRSPLAQILLGFTIDPTREPVNPRYGSPHTKQWTQTRRKFNPTHKQKIGLKFYWARSCPPVPPTRKLTQAS